MNETESARSGVVDSSRASPAPRAADASPPLVVDLLYCVHGFSIYLAC